MNPVVHFEMPYEDRERMATFYGAAFDWQMQMLGEEMGNYVLASTTETDENGPTTSGAINGGFFPKHPDWPAQYPSVVIAVEDIEASMRKVAEAGGTVLGEPMAIPRGGTICRLHRHRGQPREHAAAPAACLSLTLERRRRPPGRLQPIAEDETAAGWAMPSGVHRLAVARSSRYGDMAGRWRWAT